MHAIFTRSLYPISECEYLLKGNFYMHLVPWFLQLLPSGCPLMAWLWRQGLGGEGRVTFLGPMKLLTIRETVLGRLSPPGHCMDSRLKQTPVFLRKIPICFSKRFGLKGRLLVWYTSRGLQTSSQGMETVRCNLCIISLPYSSLPVFPKKLIPLQGAPIIAAATRGHFYITWF